MESNVRRTKRLSVETCLDDLLEQESLWGEALQVRPPRQAAQVPAGQQPFQLVAALRCLSSAARKLARGERLAGLAELLETLMWGHDLWSAKHHAQTAGDFAPEQAPKPSAQDWPHPLSHRAALMSWVIVTLMEQERASFADLGMPGEDLLTGIELDYLLMFIERALRGSTPTQPSSSADDGRLAQLARLEWACLSEVTAITAIFDGQPPSLGPDARFQALAKYMTKAERERTVGGLFRWLRVVDDYRRLGVLPVSRLKLIRRFSWDLELVLALQVEELRSLIDSTPRGEDAEAAYHAGRERMGPALFPLPPITFADKRRLLERALELMLRRPLPVDALNALADELRSIQPRTARRKRRRVRIIEDAGLYTAECFARNAASDRPDPYVTARLLVVQSPDRRLGAWHLPALKHIAEHLSRRYFGVSRHWLRNAVPPPALAESPGAESGRWLWRETSPPARAATSYLDSIQDWHAFARWLTTPSTDWTRPDARERFRQGLRLRELIRDQILLSSPSVERRAASALAEADFDLLTATERAPHAWGKEWAQAQGHMPTTHWWYYRRPIGMTDRARHNA